jgi:hypothetical protein
MRHEPDPVTEDVVQGEQHMGDPGGNYGIGGVGVRDDEQNPVLTADGDIAIDGGKLPGNKDDFDGELNERIHPVPGANSDAALSPPSVGTYDRG